MFVVGDLVVVGIAIAFGVPIDAGFVVIPSPLVYDGILLLFGKLGLYLVSVNLWYRMKGPSKIVIPIGLLLIGIGMIAWNLYVLVKTVTIEQVIVTTTPFRVVYEAAV